MADEPSGFWNPETGPERVRKKLRPRHRPGEPQQSDEPSEPAPPPQQSLPTLDDVRGRLQAQDAGLLALGEAAVGATMDAMAQQQRGVDKLGRAAKAKLRSLMGPQTQIYSELAGVAQRDVGSRLAVDAERIANMPAKPVFGWQVQDAINQGAAYAAALPAAAICTWCWGQKGGQVLIYRTNLPNCSLPGSNFDGPPHGPFTIGSQVLADLTATMGGYFTPSPPTPFFGPNIQPATCCPNPCRPEVVVIGYMQAVPYQWPTPPTQKPPPMPVPAPPTTPPTYPPLPSPTPPWPSPGPTYPPTGPCPPCPPGPGYPSYPGPYPPPPYPPGPPPAPCPPPVVIVNVPPCPACNCVIGPTTVVIDQPINIKINNQIFNQIWNNITVPITLTVPVTINQSIINQIFNTINVKPPLITVPITVHTQVTVLPQQTTIVMGDIDIDITVPPPTTPPGPAAQRNFILHSDGSWDLEMAPSAAGNWQDYFGDTLAQSVAGWDADYDSGAVTETSIGSRPKPWVNLMQG